MEWSDLRDFLTIAEQGSVSAASRVLGVTQPALSRRLLKLESALDVALFVRTERGLTLTAAGERVRALALRMREFAEQIPEAAELGHDRVSGVVRISAPEARLGTAWLPHVLLPLRAEHPDLVIELLVENRITDLSRRTADIAVRAVRPSGNDLTARRLGETRWSLFGARSYLEKRKSIERDQDLAQHDFLVYEQASDSRQSDWLEARGLASRVVFRTTSIDALISATREGWGIAALPSMAARNDPELCAVLPKIETRLDLWLVTHADLRKSRRIRTVFRFLAKCFERDRHEFVDPPGHSKRA